MLTDNALVTILLCSYIGVKDGNYKPYTAIQWSNLVSKIIYSSIKEPAKLLYLSQEEICKNLSINTDESDRIKKLLSRGANIAFKLEEFERKGISIITRSDNNYPYRLKSLLKKSAPPIIYYSGDISIANYKGIAIVGSRNIDKDGEQFAKDLARKAAEENLSVISGGARGIDSISENSALNNGGRVISVLADSLLKKLKIKDVRDSINSGKLLLMTANNPDAPFTAGGAMNRNKFIYVLSQSAFVVASDYNKGGTWAGATENIKNDWVNTYVANTNNYSGNIKLIQKGAKAIDNIKDITITDLLSNNIKNSEQLDIFDLENCIANEERKE